eukprot:CAMPEP_0196806274 /NCGR_PEP_ID=MMETSP1362-20130617/6157_1 /TAXON_ID=163516 /ORGANISM="Leptocylindrus danicus, Strain CCMP1856" /LENGTH=605 /DNA_ID=CAMNT_0042179683 /DNA_START=109 /DNA_END=1926 /DNA_ORIENTATION=-
MDQPLLDTSPLINRANKRWADEAQVGGGLVEELFIVSVSSNLEDDDCRSSCDNDNASLPNNRAGIWRYLPSDGDRRRVLLNCILLGISIAHIPLILESQSSPWWNTVRTISFANGKSITYGVLEKNFDETLDAFRDSDTYWLISIYCKISAIAFPWTRMAAIYYGLLIVSQGPSVLRNSIFGNDVAIIRPSTIERASEQYEESNYISRDPHDKFRDWSFNMVTSSWDYLFISGKWKYGVVYLWMVVLVLSSITKEVKVGDVTIKTESEIKVGVFWFWFCSFLSLVAALIIKLNYQRWVRRERAIEMYIEAREKDANSRNKVGKLDIDKSDIEAQLKSRGQQSRDTSILTSFDGDEKYDDESYDEIYSESFDDSYDEGDYVHGSNRCHKKIKKFLSQHYLSIWISFACLSRFILIFLPVIRFSYSHAGADIRRATSVEYAIRGAFHRLSEAAYEKSSARLLEAIMCIDIIVMPIVILSICVALKYFQEYKPSSKYISTLYHSLISLEMFSNVESFCVAVFMTVWSVKYVARYLNDEVGICESAGLEDGCMSVEGEFVSGSWFLLIYSISQSYSVYYSQLFFSQKLMDRLTVEEYGVILQPTYKHED